MVFLLAMLASLQQQPSSQSVARSSIARVSIEPSEVALQVGDTVRLNVSGQDSAGRPIKDLTVRWFQSGGHFEGKVDSTGLVTGGSTGTLTVSAVVSRPAGGPPATGFARVTVLPQPAVRLSFNREISKLYAGQSLTMEAVPYAANN